MFFSVDLLENVLYVLGGFLSGIVNTVAGSGSAFTLGLMLLFNIPIDLSNGTNRIGILTQGVVNFQVYKKKGALELKGISIFLIPSLLGALLGAVLGVRLPVVILNSVVAVLMIGVFFLYTFKNTIKEKFFTKTPSQNKRPIWVIIIFFLVGLYGGFIQMGIGLMMMVGFSVITNFGTVKLNGIKNFIILAYSIPVTVIYIFQHKVLWDVALFLTFGQSVGAYICSKWSLKTKKLEKPVSYIVRSMIVIVVAKSLYTIFTT